MSMFCYQCQETAMGTGCTLKGVCGKTSEVANLQDLLLFVIRGIAVYNEHLRQEGHTFRTGRQIYLRCPVYHYHQRQF